MLGVAVLATLLNIPYSLIAPIVPLELIRRDVSQLVIGFFFAVYGLAQIMTPFFVYRLMRNNSLVRLGQGGVLLLIMSLAGFGLASFIPPTSLFLATSFFMRFLQGVGTATEHTTFPLILSSHYAEEQALVTALYQTFKIVGVCSGPFIGGLLYSALGYTGIFLLVALLCSLKLFIIQVYKAVPQQPQRNDSVSLWTPFTRAQTLMAVLNCYIFYQLLEGLEPILPGKLKRDFSFETQQVSLYFFAELLSAFTAGIIFTFCVQLKDARSWIVYGGVVASISHFLIGPSKLFSLPNTKEIVLGGLIVNGAGFGSIAPFLYAEAWRAAASEFPQQEEEIKSIMVVVMMNLIGILHTLNPIIESAITSWLGFRKNRDLSAVFFLTYFIIFEAVSIHAKRRENLPLSERRNGIENMDEAEESPLLK